MGFVNHWILYSYVILSCKKEKSLCAHEKRVFQQPAGAVPEHMYRLHLWVPDWTGAAQVQTPYIRVKTAIDAAVVALGEDITSNC
jgi:hypothetical protein